MDVFEELHNKHTTIYNDKILPLNRMVSDHFKEMKNLTEEVVDNLIKTQIHYYKGFENIDYTFEGNPIWIFDHINMVWYFSDNLWFTKVREGYLNKELACVLAYLVRHTSLDVNIVFDMLKTEGDMDCTISGVIDELLDELIISDSIISGVSDPIIKFTVSNKTFKISITREYVGEPHFYRFKFI